MKMFLLSLLLTFNTAIAAPTSAAAQIHIKTHSNVNQNILEAHVMLENAESGLLGAAFHLNYDTKILKYLRYDEGNFLEQAAQPIYLVQNKNSKIYFGATLKRGEGLARGNGKLVTFYFEPIKSGKSKFSFSNTYLAGFEGKKTEVKADWSNQKLQIEANLKQIEIENENLIIGSLTILAISILILLFKRGFKLN